MILSTPVPIFRTLLQRDRDPGLASLRLYMHARLLLMAGLSGLGLVLLRWHLEHRVDWLWLVPLFAVAGWSWLQRFPAHHYAVARLGTLLFLGIGFNDLLRPGQAVAWALFAMVGVPVYGTLLDGLWSGSVATITLLALWGCVGAHTPDLSLRLLVIFNGLSCLCFFFTSLAFTWIFGALVQRQRLSQGGIELAGETSRRLANTLADEVTISVGRLRAALTKGLPDRRSLKELQTLLASTRQSLPRDLPSVSVQPKQLLEEQRRTTHRAFLLMALLVSFAAGVATLLLHRDSWWLAGGLTAACSGLYFWGERLTIAWHWRLRLFLLTCLGVLALDVYLASPNTRASSLAFLPVIVFYACMLDSMAVAGIVCAAGLLLLGIEWKVTEIQAWPFYGTLLNIMGLSTLTMFSFGWLVGLGLRAQLNILASKEEELRASLKDYQRVVSTLFHDLANPLAVLQTLANMPPALLLPEDHDRTLRMVERLESVTLVARKQGPAQSAGGLFSLVALDGDLHDLFQERLDARRLTLRVAGPMGLNLRVNAQLRDNLLDQLLSNAVRYAPEGGLILLTVEPSDGGMHLCLRDSGPGFPVDVLRDLAKGAAPLPRADDRGELGNGFGLLLALAAARDLGGHLSLSNAGSGGALADLWLPA